MLPAELLISTMNNPAWGDFSRWGLALVVIFVALGSGCKFYTCGLLTSSAAVLIGLVAGYVVGIATFCAMLNFGGIGARAWFAIPMPFKYGWHRVQRSHHPRRAFVPDFDRHAPSRRLAS